MIFIISSFVDCIFLYIKYAITNPITPPIRHETRHDRKSYRDIENHRGLHRLSEDEPHPDHEHEKSRDIEK